MRRYFGSIVSVTLHGAVLAAAVGIQSGAVRLPRVHSSGQEGDSRVFSVGFRSPDLRMAPSPSRENVTFTRVEPDPMPEETPRIDFDPFVSAPHPVPVPPPVPPDSPAWRPDDGRHDELSKAGNEGTAPVTAGTGRGRSGDGPGDGAAAGVYNPPPEYPASARRRGIEGEVLVEIAVDENGSCRGARILQGSGCDALDEASLEAVKRWTFRPARRGGRAVASSERVRFVFRLQT